MGLVIGLLIECSNGSNGSNDISGGFHGDVRPVMVPLPWMRVTPTTFSETPNLLRTCQSVESNQPIQPSDDFGTLPCLNLPGLRSCKACNVMLFLKDNHLCACKIYIYLYSLYILLVNDLCELCILYPRIASKLCTRGSIEHVCCLVELQSISDTNKKIQRSKP